MSTRRAYVIVTASGHHRVRCHRRGGRHRPEHVGSRPRAAGPHSSRPRHWYRARHRRQQPSHPTLRYGTLAAVIGAVTVSGWLTATGAAALAPLLAP